MGPSGVIELNVLLYSPIQVHTCFIRVQIDILIFDAPPEPFNVYVVSGSSPSIHADLELGLRRIVADKCLNEHIAGKLAALVGVEDLRPGV